MNCFMYGMWKEISMCGGRENKINSRKIVITRSKRFVVAQSNSNMTCVCNTHKPKNYFKFINLNHPTFKY